MLNFKNDTLTITLTQQKQHVIMTWTGESGSLSSDTELTQYLNNVIPPLNGRKLTIQYQTLRYMGSSAVRIIILFIKQLNTAGIPTVVTYNAQSPWQCATFQALENFCHWMPHISVQGV